jgi:hypothetical protein
MIWLNFFYRHPLDQRRTGTVWLRFRAGSESATAPMLAAAAKAKRGRGKWRPDGAFAPGCNDDRDYFQ